jgi:hypothetical protein
MKPSERYGRVILETYDELGESANLLDDLPGQHADYLSQTLDTEPPRELTREEVWLVMQGIKVALSKNLDDDYRQTLEQLLGDLESATSHEHQEEIVRWFVPNKTPNGGAPEDVREQWVGVPIPVRRSDAESGAGIVGDYLIGASVAEIRDVKVNEPNKIVTVNAIDAIKALTVAARHDAAVWWGNWFMTRHPMMGTKLMFGAHEGDLRSDVEVEEITPGASQFDSRSEIQNK